MKNNFANWFLFGGLMVCCGSVTWPSGGFFWLYYVFFCLFGIFSLLIGKRSGNLTSKSIVTTIFVCLIGCVLIYLLRIALHKPAF